MLHSRLDAHLKTSVFCHEVQLLADLRVCFIFSLILPIVDFGIWSTQSSWASVQLSHLLWDGTLDTCVSPGQVFFLADSSVSQKWVSYLILSLFLQEEREGAVITEVCRWKANSINDTEVGCSVFVFKCDCLTFVLCWPLQIVSIFEPLNFWCCTPPCHHIWGHLILRENI